MAKNIINNISPSTLQSNNILDNLVTQVYKQKDENIVANLSLFNPHNSNKVIDANIDVSLEKALLPKCSDYKLTIARFRVPLNNFYPGFTLREMFFEVIFRYNNTNYIQNTTINLDIFSILEFTAFVNSLLKQTYNLLGSGFNQNTPPYLEYNDVTGLFNFIYPTSFYNTIVVVQIHISPDLYFYLGGLPAKPSTLKPGYYELYLYNSMMHPYFSNIYDLAGASIITSSSGNTKYNSFILESEFKTGYRFNDIQSIIVTSNIPIRQEQLPLNTGLNFTSGPNNLSYISTLSVLSDFSVNITEFGQQYENLVFYPQSQFRWIDMISDNQLDRLSFGFFVQKKNQAIEKIKLNPGDSCSIKIYFVSKNKFYGYKGYD